MEECILCKIVKGDIPSFKVYEDEDFFAFLDINPNSVGHTLIIPKVHYKDFFETPTKIKEKLHLVIDKVAKAINKATNQKDMTILTRSGKSCGQTIAHLHIHLIPSSNDHPVTIGAKVVDYDNKEEVRKKIVNELK